MLKSKVAKLAVAAATIATAVAATSLGTTAASAAAAHTATTASSARPSRALAVACISTHWFSFKDAGFGGGSFGFFLTDEGHNRLVETTGTGTQWCPIYKSVHGKYTYYELESRSSGECLNVANGLIYMDSCVKIDANEHFTGVLKANGYFVLQNYATHLNMTASGLSNGAFVYVAGGPASGLNEWIETPIL